MAPTTNESKNHPVTAFLRKSPVTTALVSSVLLLGLSTGSLINGPSTELLSTVAIDTADPASDWWALVTSSFFATSWLDYLVLVVVLVVGVGVAERIVGPWKALSAFLIGGALSSVVLIGLILAGTVNDDEWLSYLGGDFIVGAYGGAGATLGAATASLNILWRRRLRTWLLAFAIMFALYVGVAQSLQLLAGATLGVFGGRMLGTGTRQNTKAGVFSSPRESRFLIATIVGVFAVGPLLTQLTSNFALGPLSTIGTLTLQNRPGPDEMAELCGGDEGCVALQDAVGINSAGAVVLSLIPLLLLLLCSEGLRRGRRLAMRTAMAINVVFATVVVIQLVDFLASSGLEDSVGLLLVYVLPAALLPAGIAALLFVTRSRFQTGSGSDATRVMMKSAGVLTSAVIGGYCIFWFVEGNLGRSTVGDLLLQLTHVLIPFPMPFVVQLPHGFMTTLIYGFGGAVIWLVFAFLAFRNFRLFHLGGSGGDEELGRVRALLQRGGGSLSWMALWDNNTYWFAPDGRAGVAYQVHNGVALTVAGPFGAAEAWPEAARAFVAHSLELGLTPCFYSAASDVGEALDGMGFRVLEVAEETLLNIETMSFKGKEWQNVRTALNRADKLGIKDQWYHYPTMPPGMRAQLAEISEEWVADKSLPEMGFTLGGIDELKDENVLCCVAVDDDGLVHGVTSWLPVYTEGQVTGWTLDFMRRRTTGFKGVMEFLIASAVTHFKADVPTISLSGSPLANAGGPPQTGDVTAVDKVLAMLGDALEPMYGFKSLAAFKSRFQPEHRTLFMYYQDPLALPSIGLAITAAYLPGLSAKQSTTIVRQMMAKEPAL
ncbi:DUF2156 domain-containing protein [Paenarthrobacter nicotinovorans]|uniref:DUF2156 domain-containing protein n=1 Tax=Paenarthrobacter nicotinovorans TaxID=29320 RepID=A0ABV0GLZ2_PAENI